MKEQLQVKKEVPGVYFSKLCLEIMSCTPEYSLE
jgi:hypothetical protein